MGAPPAVKRPGGKLKIILDRICPTAAGLAQQWWNKPVLAKERVLSFCQSVYLSVCLSVRAISHQQANMQCYLWPGQQQQQEALIA